MYFEQAYPIDVRASKSARNSSPLHPDRSPLFEPFGIRHAIQFQSTAFVFFASNSTTHWLGWGLQ